MRRSFSQGFRSHKSGILRWRKRRYSTRVKINRLRLVTAKRFRKAPSEAWRSRPTTLDAMAGHAAEEEHQRFDIMAGVASRFLMAAHRANLRSWVHAARRAHPLRFCDFQFLDKLNKTPGIAAPHPQAPWILGMGSIGIGTAASRIALG